MSITEELFSSPIDTTASGLLAGRTLHAVQLVRIARHTSHVIPVAGGGLTVLTGRGPGGASNGAGKSSLAESVLLAAADRQWTRGGAGAKAIGLLFSEKDAQQTGSALGDAPHGYLASLWLDPTDPSATALTVWMRIQRVGTDRLSVRVADGVQFALGNTEGERVAAADRAWEQLRGRPTYGPNSYGEALFGAAPGGLGYVRNRGADQSPDTGLLAVVDGMRFKSTDLARELIDLCGVADQIALEQQQRRTLAGLREQLDAARKDAEQQHAAEEQRLGEIAARRRAREARGEAEANWRVYLAAALLNAHQQYSQIKLALDAIRATIATKRTERDTECRTADGTDLREAAAAATAASTLKEQAEKEYDALNAEAAVLKARIDEITTKLSRLAPALTIAGSLNRAEAETSLAGYRQARERSEIRRGRLKEDVENAETVLAAAHRGRDGHAGALASVLRAAGTPAVPLYDLVNLDSADRTAWELRLSLLADAVVIKTSDIDTEMDTLQAALAAHPGTQLLPIAEDPEQLTPVAPDMPRDSHPLAGLLDTLAVRAPEIAGHAAVDDGDLGLVVLGGYTEPQTGRAARIRAAERTLEKIRSSLKVVEEAHSHAVGAEVAAEKLLEAVKDTETHGNLTRDSHLLSEQRAGLGLDAAKQKRDTTQKTWLAASGRLDKLREGRDEARAKADALSKELETLGKQRDELDSNLQKVPLETLRDAFGGAPADAEELLADQKPSPAYHLRRAATALRKAIDALPDLPAWSEVDDSDQLAAALLQRREWCDSATGQETASTFSDIAAPLDRWLRARGSADETIEEDLRRLRQDRTARLEVSEARIQHNADLATTAQENAKRIIRKTIRDVERQLGTMWTRAGRHKITLQLTHTEPSSADEPLTWQLGITWQATGDVAPRRYSDKVNTAEYVLVHTLLAAAALVSIANPQGRLIVIDEFGQNLDMVNIPTVAEVLKQVCQNYGLTILLACQDVAAPLIAAHCDELIEVQHVAEREALNRPPHITRGPQHPEVVRLLAPALSSGRPFL